MPQTCSIKSSAICKSIVSTSSSSCSFGSISLTSSCRRFFPRISGEEDGESRLLEWWRCPIPTIPGLKPLALLEEPALKYERKWNCPIQRIAHFVLYSWGELLFQTQRPLTDLDIVSRAEEKINRRHTFYLAGPLFIETCSPEVALKPIGDCAPPWFPLISGNNRIKVKTHSQPLWKTTTLFWLEKSILQLKIKCYVIIEMENQVTRFKISYLIVCVNLTFQDDILWGLWKIPIELLKVDQNQNKN